MANLTEADDWASGIYQIEEGDPVLGGPTGLTNTPPRQLANRTLYQRLRNVTPWDAALLYPAQAYVQYAGKTYRSAAININVVPGTDATKWERWGFTLAELNAEAATPAQFDSTTKLATTAFANSLGLKATGVKAVSANAALSLADVGKIIDVTGAGAYTVTLPAAATVKNNSGYLLSNRSTGIVTIGLQAGDAIQKAAMAPGDTVLLLSDGANFWYRAFDPNLASPAFTGTPTSTTPAQFDASTKLATTAFVQTALGNFQSTISPSAATALTAAQSGALVAASGTGYTLTLPAPAIGLRYTIYTTSAGGAITLATPSGLLYLGGSNAASMVMPPNVVWDVIGLGGAWIVVQNALTLGRSGTVQSGSTLAANGVRTNTLTFTPPVAGKVIAIASYMQNANSSQLLTDSVSVTGTGVTGSNSSADAVNSNQVHFVHVNVVAGNLVTIAQTSTNGPTAQSSASVSGLSYQFFPGQ